MDEADLLGLLLKLIYRGRLQTVRQFGDAIKLPYNIVLELVSMAVNRQLLQNLGSRSVPTARSIWLHIHRTGQAVRDRRDDPAALHRSCAGDARRVHDQVNLQKLTNELVHRRRSNGDEGSEFDESIMEQAGPALNSGRAMLLYGPPGNGKTTVAQRFASVFTT